MTAHVVHSGAVPLQPFDGEVDRVALAQEAAIRRSDPSYARAGGGVEGGPNGVERVGIVIDVVVRHPPSAGGRGHSGTRSTMARLGNPILREVQRRVAGMPDAEQEDLGVKLVETSER